MQVGQRDGERARLGVCGACEHTRRECECVACAGKQAWARARHEVGGAGGEERGEERGVVVVVGLG